MTQKLPDIPSLSSAVPAEVRRAFDVLRTAFKAWSGRGGLLTSRDLVDVGLLDGRGGSNLPDDFAVSMLPPAPPDFSAVGGFNTIFLRWGAVAAGYRLAFTEVYRATADDFGEAALVARVPWPALVHADVPADSSASVTYFYWIRFVNAVGPGPLNAAHGTAASTATDPAYLLEVLSGQITESQLYHALTARIDKIDAPGTGLLAKAAALQAEIDTINATLADIAQTPQYDELATYAVGDLVTYEGGLYRAILETTGNLPTDATYWEKIGDYASLGDAVSGLSAAISALETRVEATENGLVSEATQRNTLATQIRGNYTGSDLAQLSAGLLYQERQARSTADASEVSARQALAATLTGFADPTGKTLNQLASGLVFEEKTARVSAVQAEADARAVLAAQINHPSTGLPAAHAAVAAEAQTRADEDGALSQAILQLDTTVGEHATSIQQQALSIDGLSAQYTVKIDNNGFMSGFGLASEPIDGVPFSEFLAMADRFAVINPNASVLAVSSITRSGSTATATTSTAHGLATDDYVVVSGAAQREYNGSHKITVTTTTKFTFPVAGTPATPATVQTGFAGLRCGRAVIPLIVQDGKVVINSLLADEITVKRAMIELAAIDDARMANVSAAKLLAGVIQASNIFLGADSKVHFDGANQRIDVRDASNVLRVRLGNLGTGWGLEIFDAAGQTILNSGGVSFRGLTAASVSGVARSELTSFARTSTAYHPITGAQVVNGEPRYKAGGGIFVERGTTNLQESPFDLTQAIWLKQSMSVSGQKVIPAAVSAGHYIYQDRPLTNAVTYTQSVVAKASEMSFLQISTSTGFALGHLNFDLVNGILGTGTIPGKIQSLGDGWWLCSATVPATSTTTGRMVFGPVPASNSSRVPTYTGNGADGLFIRAVQLEALPYPTSATVGTRNEEEASVTDAIVDWNSDFTVEVDAQCLTADTGTYRMPAACWTYFYFSITPENQLRFSFHDNGAQVSLNGPTLSVAQQVAPHRWAVTRSGNLLSFYFDGVLIASHTLVNPPVASAYGHLAIGNLSNQHGYYWNGWVGSVRVSNVARTAEEIAENIGLPLDADESTSWFCDFRGTLRGYVVTDASAGHLAAESKDFIETIYPADKSDLQNQIDGKITTWFQTADPNTWPAGDRAKHNGDIWYKSDTKESFRYNGTANTWETIQDKDALAAIAAAATAQDTADGKRRVFTATPVPPYDIGDLWDRGATLGIWRCNLARAAGQSHSVSYWQVVADSTANNTAYDTARVGGDLASKVVREGNKLTGANIGTYMNSAAIGTAYIQDAAVTTLKIGANAVIVPASSYTSSQVTVGTAWTIVAQVSLDTLGQPCFVMASLEASFQSYMNTGGSFPAIGCRIVRGETILAEYGNSLDYLESGSESATISGKPQILTVALSDTPPTGTNTYYLQVYGINYAGSLALCSKRSLAIIGTKGK